MVEIDVVNRDPNNMNNYVQVVYDDVLAEPDGAHSADCVWNNSYKCFNCGMKFWYRILSCFCGLCIALGWGCAFAEVAFGAVWCCTPWMRLVTIVMYPLKKVMSILLGTCCGPYIETLGLIFSRIHVVNSEGPAPKPFDHL